MIKEQLIELIFEYERVWRDLQPLFVTESHTLPTGKCLLQDRIKVKPWYLFSGQYDIYLERALKDLFRYQTSEILQHLIFTEEIENLAFYLEVNEEAIKDLYQNILYQEAPRVVTGFQMQFEKK